MSYYIFKEGELLEPTSKPLGVGIYYIYDPVAMLWIRTTVGIAKGYSYIEYDELPANIKAIALLTI